MSISLPLTVLLLCLAQEPDADPALTFHRAPRPLPEGAVTEDWTGFLGPRRDGHSLETKTLTAWTEEGPPLVWERTRGESYAGPAIAAGRLVYTHRIENEVYVDGLDPETGELKWRFTTPCEYRGRYIRDGGPRATPEISEGRVYVHGVEGVLHCLDLATGEKVWERDVSADFDVAEGFFGAVSSPVVHGDLLLQNIGGDGGPTVAAFDKATGELVWGAGEAWGASCASPVLANVHERTRLFVFAGGDTRPPSGGLLVLDPSNGAIDFEYPLRSRTYESVNGASPVIADGRVFLTASYNTGTAALELKKDGGYEELWKTRAIGMQFSNPVYANGHLYAIDGRSDRAGAVICLDPATGAELARTDIYWEERLVYQGEEQDVSLSIGEGSLLAVDGGFLSLGDNGHLLRLDCTPGGTEVLARAALFHANESWTPLALSRGLLYACQNRTERFGVDPQPPRLLCYDLRGED